MTASGQMILSALGGLDPPHHRCAGDPAARLDHREDRRGHHPEVVAVDQARRRLAKGMEGADEKPLSVENVIAQIVYYVIIFMAVLAALNALGLTQITALVHRHAQPRCSRICPGCSTP